MNTETTPSLNQLGWRPYFQQQLSLEEFEQYQIGRISEQHRNSNVLLTEKGQLSLVSTPNDVPVCVGDWVLYDTNNRLVRVLERQSLFQRKAAGTKVNSQLIAANVDQLFIVSSLNSDFSLNRIERYLAIAKEAEVEPIIILTKADQCTDIDTPVEQVQKLNPLIIVHAINALDSNDLNQLEPYCKAGKTLALLGSSGVGKSTLMNGLMGINTQATAEIRESDGRGRHTTTARSLKWLPSGGIFIDTPGMRELQLVDCETGVNETFSEIINLAKKCRFSDCSHNSEPGCAVQKAIENGQLELRRLQSFNKLHREQELNSATIAEKRSKDKSLGKMIHRVQAESRQMKNKSYEF
ncbi:ribosome small subunit-dependent GTPase A [Psychrosphaera haliotis]|uniref:Small ribosomal subunit biogenesis GTPase RsgA n=1 Tax=Psychrosphaera haliotis TaxID=555083 RepID=A0A6N8F4A7_9GAMM|nr:ribosome small subunit-dependent GTPase A [Psychrosphaera haliotis]MUH71405.1 ribosome small subunit-dependent GTPase A [Psychrosphaera haliotis]